MGNFFSKVSLLFKNFSEVKNYIVKIYEILIHLKPVIQFADMLIPNETKVQIKFDSITSVVYPALEKAIAALETASNFLGVPLPVVKSVGVNADAVAALKKVVNS